MHHSGHAHGAISFSLRIICFWGFLRVHPPSMPKANPANLEAGYQMWIPWMTWSVQNKMNPCIMDCETCCRWLGWRVILTNIIICAIIVYRGFETNTLYFLIGDNILCSLCNYSLANHFHPTSYYGGSLWCPIWSRLDTHLFQITNWNQVFHLTPPPSFSYPLLMATIGNLNFQRVTMRSHVSWCVLHAIPICS